MADREYRRRGRSQNEEQDYERRGFDSSAYGNSGYADPDFEAGRDQDRWNRDDEVAQRYGSGSRRGGGGRYRRNWYGYGVPRRDSFQGFDPDYDSMANYGDQTWYGGERGGRFQGYDPDYSSTANYGEETWYGRDSSMRWRGPHVGKGPRGYRRSDDRIKEDVSEALSEHGWIDASDIDVKVRGGVVTLEGTVDSRRTKRLAEDVIDSVRGIHDVQNNLRIQSAAGEKPRRGRPRRTPKTEEGGQSQEGG